MFCLVRNQILQLFVEYYQKPTYAHGAMATIIIIDLNHPLSELAKGCKLLISKLLPKKDPRT